MKRNRNSNRVRPIVRKLEDFQRNSNNKFAQEEALKLQACIDELMQIAKEVEPLNR
ncbi:hypothetical protein L0244_19630 [bacterium]|nr:hypothetical protein [bacterium]MCI0615207.1 hypothetical protein [bacterium]